MVTILKKGKPVKDLIKALEALIAKSNQGFDAKKYSGILDSNVSPISYQQLLRDEWK
jgi:hypothetical protein